MKQLSGILLTFFLAGITTLCYSQTFDLGEINGAKYKIYIPENWNKGLVMYAHGYEEIGEETGEFTEEVDEFMEIFTSRGFAYAASTYKRQGFVIKDGIEDTEVLRSYFELTYSKPETCIVTGHSMGGMIALATIEKFPAEYSGAMPMCGWMAPVYSLTKRSLDMLVCYDYLFGTNDGKIVLGDTYIENESIQENLNNKPELRRLLAEHFRIREEELAEVIEFNQYVFKESTSFLGGLPAGNMKTIYCGFGDNDTLINNKILRYKADPAAKDYFIQYYTPTGEILDPVIALHTSYDELAPVFSYRYYEQLTEIKHTNELYEQQYVIRDGHCNFTVQEIARTFDQLLVWIREDHPPKGMNP